MNVVTVSELSDIDKSIGVNDIMTGEHTPHDIFRDRLRFARTKLCAMSQAELGEATNLPSTSIAHFEQGSRRPSFDNLRKIATALDVSVDYLMGRVDNPRVVGSSDSLGRYGDQLSAKNRAFAEDILRLMVKHQHRDREDSE